MCGSLVFSNPVTYTLVMFIICSYNTVCGIVLDNTYAYDWSTVIPLCVLCVCVCTRACVRACVCMCMRVHGYPSCD